MATILARQGKQRPVHSDSWKLREADVLYSKFADFHGMRNHTQYREGAFSSKIGSGDDNTRGCFTS